MRFAQAISGLLVAGMVFVGSLSGQVVPAGTPVVVLRRAAQAIWPDQLFDSTGHPEPGFVVDGFRPSFADLVIERRSEQVSRLPGVEFYYAHAYSSGCSHCRNYVAAVAVRGDSSLTLMSPNDVNKLIPWFSAPIAAADSTSAREFLLETIRASCIIGCRTRWLRPSERLSENDSLYARHADPRFERQDWKRPRTYSHVSPGQLTMEFLLLDPARAIWVAHVQQQHGARSLNFFVEESAWLEFPP